MEPQLPSPNIGPERAPSQPEKVTPPSISPEVSPESQSYSGERQETRENQPSGPHDPPPQTQPAPPPPPLPSHIPATDDKMLPADGNPTVAADEDLIEKEWVEKAKKVIAETKHDPYLQEQAVSKLQADYLQKRYNKTVKVPDDSA